MLTNAVTTSTNTSWILSPSPRLGSTRGTRPCKRAENCRSNVVASDGRLPLPRGRLVHFGKSKAFSNGSSPELASRTDRLKRLASALSAEGGRAMTPSRALPTSSQKPGFVGNQNGLLQAAVLLMFPPVDYYMKQASSFTGGVQKATSNVPSHHASKNGPL